MIDKDNWQELFIREINDAESARKRGNEGKARVCARRAAGIVIREYFNRNEIHTSEMGAYSLLKKMTSLPHISEDVRETVHHFIVRITPQKQMPIDADLISDAYWLAERLINIKH